MILCYCACLISSSLSLRSALQRSPGPLLPASLELGAQLGSLQPGSQLQPASLLLLHHLQSELRLPAGKPPVSSRQRCPSSISPCSFASEWVSGQGAPASPHQPPLFHHPSAGLRLWAGAGAQSQAGDRQPVHVALTPLSHPPPSPPTDGSLLWSQHAHTHAYDHAHIIQAHFVAPPSFTWVYETLREHMITADSWTWACKSLSDECAAVCISHRNTHSHSLGLCWVCVYQRQILTTSTPSPSVHSECILGVL